jgi:molybdopterin molybdotransferase
LSRGDRGFSGYLFALNDPTWAADRWGALAAARAGKGSLTQTPQQAWSTIVEQLPEPAASTVPCAEALGYVLAESVRADRDLPPADRSAMDGFALRTADLDDGPVTLRLVREIAAGESALVEVRSGTCARIFTGANLPPGADAVVMVEDARTDGDDRIGFTGRVAAGANVWRRGEDAHQGEVLIPAGQRLGAVHLGACAAVGLTDVRVYRKPRVAILTTGRELMDAGMAVATHQLRDSNGPMLEAALVGAGFSVVLRERVTDDLAAITARLVAALALAEVVVTSGGVSVGAYDFVPRAVRAVGARVLVHGVAMKPGKPLLCAMAAEGRPIFGLPGNPLSTMTGLYELVLPALRRMAGWSEQDCRPLLRGRLRTALVRKPGRQRHIPAKLAWTPQGIELAVVPSRSSADLVSAARADGAIVVPAGSTGLDAGALVDFRPWRAWP